MLSSVILALVMGIDAFTLAMGVAFRGIRLKWVLILSATVGLFHAGMPFAGMVAGKYIGVMLGRAAVYAGGSVFILLGVHMMVQSWLGEPDRVRNPFTVWGVLVFSFGVSLDSFSVGLSLGLFATKYVVTILIFGIAGGLAALFGILLGRHLAGWLGKYGEMVGGAVLIGWGLRFIL